MLWMSDAKDSHNDHKLRHWCHYWCAPRSCRLQVQNEMCMFNLESLETTGMVRCFAYINATSRSGKGEWRLIDDESTVCVVVFFEILDSSRLSVARCTIFAWLWLVAGADLLWEKSTAGWLVAARWCWFGVREKYYWLDAANRVIIFQFPKFLAC